MWIWRKDTNRRSVLLEYIRSYTLKRTENPLPLLQVFSPVTTENAPTTLPTDNGSDFVRYLVLQASFLTGKQFNTHKLMEACIQFVCRWVRTSKRGMRVANLCLLERSMLRINGCRIFTRWNYSIRHSHHCREFETSLSCCMDHARLELSGEAYHYALYLYEPASFILKSWFENLL